MEDQSSNFSFGKQIADKNDKKGKKKPEKLVEERMQETFNTQGSKDHEDLKRKREDYAVQLRKKKKDEMFKQKRATGQGNTIPLGIGQNGSQMRDSQATTEGLNGTTKQEALIQMSIDQALQLAQTMTFNDFVLMAQRMQFTMNDLLRLNQLIHEKDDIKQTFATIGFRRLLSFERNPPIQTVIDMNLVPKFLSLLSRFDQPKLQFEAAWCITNLASGNNDHVQVLLEKGAIETLISLLQSDQLDVIEQAIWGLGNIAGENNKVRDMVINAKAVEPISRILDQSAPGTSLIRNASWALSNFCRGRPPPDFAKVKRAIPSLAKVLNENDNEDILIDVCWAMSYLSDGGEERIPVILNSGVLPRIIYLLGHQNMAICVPCLRAVGNVVTGDDTQTQYAIDNGALIALNNIIYHKKRTVRKEVCWTLSNITAGSADQIQQCIDLGIMDKLINLLINDEIEIKKEAVWAVSNCTSGATPQQFHYLVQRGILKGLGSILVMKESRVLAVALEGIGNILKCGKKYFTVEGENQFALVFEKEGGIDKLEALQMHPNIQIYDRVVKILESYFQEENNDIMIDNENTGISDNGTEFTF